ncbi:hypothetical protein BE61_76070 [Bradyrhizobium elkanii USDA 61]|nr:hypothetical protein BE61_76070 [Bradyrhizobium elkanii USDA 61]GEC56979.1 hypothetical protein BEL01nite_60220 [Bradyrhizobium elkanii]
MFPREPKDDRLQSCGQCRRHAKPDHCARDQKRQEAGRYRKQSAADGCEQEQNALDATRTKVVQQYTDGDLGRRQNKKID